MGKIIFLIFIIWFISTGWKKIFAKDPAKRKQLVNTLRDSFAQIVKEIEKSKLDQTARPRKKESQDRGTELWEYLGGDIDDIDEDVNEEIVPPALPQKAVKAEREKFDPAYPPIRDIEPLETDIKYDDYAVENLRQAIVWAEILDKPMALRDE